MQQLTIDTSALTAPVTSEDKQRYSEHKRKLSSRIMTSLIAAAVPIFIALVVIRMFSGLQDGMPTPVVIGILIPAVALSILAFFITVRGGTGHIRLNKFADANGFAFHRHEPVERLRGVLFDTGGSRRNRNVVQMHGNVRLGNYQYSTGSGKHRTTHYWRYIEVPLPRNMPHLVLDSTDNNGIFGTNLPVTLQRSQRIELEGDFNRHFTLYAPEGYGVDVRYILPPDTMALLVDNLSTFDLEFIDDRLMIIASGSWEMHDDKPWRFAEWVVNVLHPHIVDRTDRYVDDRAGFAAAAAPGAQETGHHAAHDVRGTVGSSGKRLKRGFPIISVVFFIVVAAAVFLPRLL